MPVVGQLLQVLQLLVLKSNHQLVVYGAMMFVPVLMMVLLQADMKIAVLIVKCCLLLVLVLDVVVSVGYDVAVLVVVERNALEIVAVHDLVDDVKCAAAGGVLDVAGGCFDVDLVVAIF